MNLEDVTRRMGTPDDMELLYSISRQALRDQVEENFGPWKEEQQRERFVDSTDPTTHELFFSGGQAIGFWSVARRPAEIYLERITVVPSHQNRGFGTSLLHALFAEANANSVAVRLRVFPSNPAQRLYRRLGFREEKRTDTHVHLIWETDRNLAESKCRS